MAQPKKHRENKKTPLIDTLPGLLVSALAGHDDFILTFETDKKTNTRKVHVLTGKFITPRMLKKLLGQAEAQRDEGSTMVTRDWA